MNHTDEEIALAMEILGVTPEDFVAADRGPRALANLKERAKRSYRAAVLELHPDRTGNDDKKTALFRVVSDVLNEIEDMRYVPMSRPRRLVFRVL